MVENMLLKTERLHIRPVTEEDWQSIKAIRDDFSSSVYAQYDRPFSTEESNIRARVLKWANANSGIEHMFFAVCLQEKVIGYVAFNLTGDEYEIGYCFHSDFYGKGYAKESHIALFNYLRTLGITRFSAGTAMNNLPSVRLLKSLGFELVGTESVSFYKDSDGNDIIFEGGIFMYNQELLTQVCEQFQIELFSIDNFIDTSHGNEDIRYNYVINKMYVVKINTTKIISNNFLTEIDALVDRYRSIGVWCPKLFKNKFGKYLSVVQYDSVTYNCYVEEYAPYMFTKDEDIYILKRKMIRHLGKLASAYSNRNLVEHFSMWSIIDLSLMQQQVDEKQENLNHLISVLCNVGSKELANKLMEINNKARMILKEHYKRLPRCVFQGDLNPSNLLVDSKNNFVGIIDFNMFGTEVNINCFINESMYYMDEEDFQLPAEQILAKANRVRDELLESILEEYQLNDLEIAMMPFYKMITDISFYPNVQLWIYLLEQGTYKEKVIDLIEKITACWRI